MSETIQIVELTPEKVESLSTLALALWPDSSLETEMEYFSSVPGSSDRIAFLACQDRRAIGFSFATLRTDYVEGTSGGTVCYLEGIYVEKAARRKGVGQALLAHVEAWGRSKGCTELGSDAETVNKVSIGWHVQSGFREANRVVCYIKPIR